VNKKLFLNLLTLLLFTVALVGCGEQGADGSLSGRDTGVGGSTARMAIVGDFLYAISGRNLQLFDISEPQAPNPWVKVDVSREIQTLFPYQNFLLIGAADGVYILDNSDQASPVQVGEFTHATAQDPVVAQDGYAYVTLKSDFTRPNGFIDDQLNVVDIRDVTNPVLVGEQAMQAPEGLVIADNKLFVCDGIAGLKQFDISDPEVPVFEDSLPMLDCNDLIAQNNILYVITDSSIHQYDYSVTPLAFISTLSEGVN